MMEEEKTNAQEEEAQTGQQEEETKEPRIPPIEAARRRGLETGKKDAYTEICQGLGITPEQLAQKIIERKADSSRTLYDYDFGFMPFPIEVNGQPIPAKGRATRAEIELYQEMVGKKRLRLLNERIGRDFEVLRALGGGFQAKLVRVVQEGA